jgi:hypothetical protein
MRLTAIVLATATSLAAGDPLGTVERIDGNRVWVRFITQAPSLGRVLAIAGAPQIERHPLTGQVIIERPTICAKAQVTAVGAVTEATVFWKSDTALRPGFDAIILAGEQAPNGAPGPSATLAPITGAAGTAVEVRPPLADPDQDITTWKWSLSGAPGAIGRLEWSTSREPMVRWLPPAVGGTATLNIHGRDVLGQSWTGSLPLSAGPANAPNPVLGQRLGEGPEPALTQLIRRADGKFAGISGESIMVHDVGWTGAIPVSVQTRRPTALAVRNSEWAVLDASSRQFVILSSDGAVKSQVEKLVAPSDATGTLDGWAIVDTGLGGIVVVEADGQWRCLLGRSEGSKGPTRVVGAPDGSIAALDPHSRQILRWDRWLHPLPTWFIPSDAGNTVDIEAMGSQVLVLADDGRLTLLDDKGRAAGSGIGDPTALGITPTGKASDLLVDGDTAYVCWPTDGFIVRAGAPGPATGVRGASLRVAPFQAIDGSGSTWLMIPDQKKILTVDPEGWVVGRRPMPEGVSSPVDFAVSASGGELYVLDVSGGLFGGGKQQVVRAGQSTTVMGSLGSGAGQFQDARSICVDESGRTYVLDVDEYRVSVFNSQGSYVFAIGAYGKTQSALKSPLRIAISPSGDRLYVYDSDERQVKRFDLDHNAGTGTFGAFFGGKGDGPLQLRDPVGMWVDRRGHLLIVDGDRDDVQAVDFTGPAARLLWTRRIQDLGLLDIIGASCSPDGHLLIRDARKAVWLRW